MSFSFATTVACSNVGLLGFCTHKKVTVIFGSQSFIPARVARRIALFTHLCVFQLRCMFAFQAFRILYPQKDNSEFLFSILHTSMSGWEDCTVSSVLCLPKLLQIVCNDAQRRLFCCGSFHLLYKATSPSAARWRLRASENARHRHVGFQSTLLPSLPSSSCGCPSFRRLSLRLLQGFVSSCLLCLLCQLHVNSCHSPFHWGLS